MQMQSVMNQCESEIQQTHSDYDVRKLFCENNIVERCSICQTKFNRLTTTRRKTDKRSRGTYVFKNN
jgi:hypothetical protein